MDASSVPETPTLLDQYKPIETEGSVSSDKLSGSVHPSSPVTGLGHFSASPIAASPTTPSPFSATRPRGLSFDLNSLWQSAPATIGTSKDSSGIGNGGQADERDISRTPKSPELPISGSGLLEGKNNKDGNRAGGSGHGRHDELGLGGDGVRNLGIEPEPMEVVGVANDDDFDMFLAEEKDEVVVSAQSQASAPVPKADKPPAVPRDPEAAFEATPHCWTGKVCFFCFCPKGS
jgi:hypothetical protein